MIRAACVILDDGSEARLEMAPGPVALEMAPGIAVHVMSSPTFTFEVGVGGYAVGSSFDLTPIFEADHTVRAGLGVAPTETIAERARWGLCRWRGRRQRAAAILLGPGDPVERMLAAAEVLRGIITEWVP